MAMMNSGKIIRRLRNNASLLSFPSPGPIAGTLSAMETNAKHLSSCIVGCDGRHHRQQQRQRQQPLTILSFSTSTKNPSEEYAEEDYSKFSLIELKQLATKSLKQQQRQHDTSSLESSRADRILKHILDRISRDDGGQQADKDAANIQTALIDSWTTFQSSKTKDIKDTIKQEQEVASDEETTQQQQKLQAMRLREVCSAAESMTMILDSMENPTTHHYVAILKAWSNTCKIARRMGRSKAADVVGIPQRTQIILNEMGGGDSTTAAGDDNINVSVEAYNEVIKAWAYSSEYLRGTMAEQMFQKLQFPTGESLRLITKAHAWSNESRSAFQATGHFMRMMRLLESGRDDMEASSMDDYHLLCDAWTNAGDKNSSSKVYSVLQIMNNAYDKGHTDLRPDLRCYRDALVTMSRRQNVEDVGYLADETLKQMKDRMVFPDTECYRSAILAWKHVAMSRDCEHPERAIQRTRELLGEMREAYHRTTEVLIQPASEDYNHVLHAMSLSRNPQTADRAQEIFRDLKDESSLTTGGPNAQSYRYMLGVLKNSRSPSKLDQALKLLQEVMDSYKNDEEWRNEKSSKESTMDAFAAFVRVCGAPTTTPKNSSKDLRHERTKTMTIALSILDDSRKLGLTLNSDSYTALVEACDYLLPAHGQERENVLRNVFGRACDEGFVNQALLESFRSAASTHVYAELVVSKSILVEDTKIVPESWTRNVRGFREGKQVMPLSIHGNFTFTKSAAEYRMRKLRRRTNQKMLRGGRLK